MMGIFTRWFGSQSEVAIARAVERVVEDKLRATLTSFSNVEGLRNLVDDLKRQKATLSEDIAREKLDMKHKLGLERMRQEQEAEMAQEKLKAERDRLGDERDLVMSKARFEAKEEALKESREMMDAFQDRQEEMIKMLLKRLPSAEIFASVER